jgi:hypothetical protein
MLLLKIHNTIGRVIINIHSIKELTRNNPSSGMNKKRNLKKIIYAHILAFCYNVDIHTLIIKTK